MSFVIRRDAGGMPTFLSLSAGKKVGKAMGAWVQDINEAIQFAREQDGQEFAEAFYVSLLQSIRVVRA